VSLAKEIEKRFPEMEQYFGAVQEDINKEHMRTNHFAPKLWVKSRLLYQNPEFMNSFKKSGIDDPDEMAVKILEMFYKHMQALRP
jgi:hypothetical protein